MKLPAGAMWQDAILRPSGTLPSDVSAGRLVVTPALRAT